MPKHKEYTVTLISSGLILDALHYGLFVIIGRFLGLLKNAKIQYFLHPIRLYMKILVILKD